MFADRQEKTMSLLFQFGLEAPLKSRSGKFLLLSSALWSLACVQSDAATLDAAQMPLAVHAAITVAPIQTPIKTAQFTQKYVDFVPPVHSNLTASFGYIKQTRAAASDDATRGDVTLDFVDAEISDVLKALAVQTGANIVSSADVKGSVTVSLAHVTLDQALDMVTRLSGFHYAKVGETYVVGSSSGVNDLTGSSDDSQVTAVVPFTYASFKELDGAVKERFPDLITCDGSGIDGSRQGSGLNVEILSGDAATVSQARDLINQIDASLGSTQAEQTTSVYRVQYASISDLTSILASLVPSVTVTLGPSQGFTSKAPSASGSSAGGSSGGSGSSGSSETGSSGGSSGSSGSSGGSSSGGSQTPSTGPNLLILTGSLADITRAQGILSQVDVRPAQIDFEAKVTEIDINKVNNIGLNWNFSGATTRIGEMPDNVATPPPTLGANKQTNLLSFGAIGRTSISDLATVSLDALLTNNDAKLLADPNISAVDGEPAQVFIGNTVNYVQSITQTTTGEDVTTGSVQVGVILRVTGKIGADGYITLNIHPEVSDITGYLSVPGGGSLPQVASRYADTTVRVKNGETIAIGGLIQENDTKSINSVPGLGSLPLIGKLFQDSQDNKSRTEVVFLLTTKVSS